MDSFGQEDLDVNFEKSWLDTWLPNAKFVHWRKAIMHEPMCSLPMVNRVRMKFARLGEEPGEDDICRVVSKTNEYYRVRSKDFHAFPIDEKSGTPNRKHWVDKHPDRTAPRLGYYERKLLLNCSSAARTLRRQSILRTNGILPENPDRFVDFVDDEVALNASEQETAAKMLRALERLELLPAEDLRLLKLRFSQNRSSRLIAAQAEYNVSHVIICRRITKALSKARIILWADQKLRELFVDDLGSLEGRSE
jgi:hypothetical protein